MIFGGMADRFATLEWQKLRTEMQILFRRLPPQKHSKSLRLNESRFRVHEDTHNFSENTYNLSNNTNIFSGIYS